MAAFAQSFKHALFAGFMLAGSGAAYAAPERPPAHRIVSTSLCGDAYVTALSDPQNITALSWQADTKLSATAGVLRRKNKGFANAERLLSLNADLIVLGPGESSRTTNAAQKAGARAFALDWVESFDGVYKNLAALGKASGRKSQANAKIARIKARLQAVPPPKKPIRVLYLTPNGSSAGAGAFVDQAIRAAGGINHATTLGVTGWGRVPLEKLVLDPPDLILTSFFKNGYPSINNLRSRHPLLHHVLQTIPTAHIAAKNWICAGPLLINAVEDIAAAMDQLDARGGS